MEKNIGIKKHAGKVRKTSLTFFVSSSLCKRLRHEEISDRFLSVSPLLLYRGKTIESHCLDDDSALKKKKSLFSLDSFYDCDCGVPSRNFCE